MSSYKIQKELKNLIKAQGVGPFKLKEENNNGEEPLLKEEKHIELNINTVFSLQQKGLLENDGSKILIKGENGKIEANIGDFLTEEGEIVKAEKMKKYKPVYDEKLQDAVKRIIQKPSSNIVEKIEKTIEAKKGKKVTPTRKM